jgi:hypothetical protein
MPLMEDVEMMRFNTYSKVMQQFEVIFLQNAEHQPAIRMKFFWRRMEITKSEFGPCMRYLVGRQVTDMNIYGSMNHCLPTSIYSKCDDIILKMLYVCSKPYVNGTCS